MRHDPSDAIAHRSAGKSRQTIDDVGRHGTLRCSLKNNVMTSVMDKSPERVPVCSDVLDKVTG